MDYTALRFWVDIGQTIVMACIGIYLYWDRRDRATRKTVSDLGGKMDARMDGHDGRIAAIEANCKIAPKHKDLAAIYDKINTVASKVDDMGGEMRGVNSGLQMIHRFLLENGGKSS